MQRLDGVAKIRRRQSLRVAGNLNKAVELWFRNALVDQNATTTVARRLRECAESGKFRHVSLDGIKEVLHQTPFRPFVIRMTSGKEYVVEHQDLIGASKTYRRLYVAINEDDRVDILDTLMIESLHYIPERAAA
jgi:hypothetical protein